MPGINGSWNAGLSRRTEVQNGEIPQKQLELVVKTQDDGTELGAIALLEKECGSLTTFQE